MKRRQTTAERAPTGAHGGIAMLLLVVLAIGACGEKKSTSSLTPKEKISAPAHDSAGVNSVQCPVCGLSFSKSDSVKSYRYKNKEYYFYIKDHYEEFSRTPEKYIDK